MAAEIARGLSEPRALMQLLGGLRPALRREPAQRGPRGRGLAIEDPVAGAVAAHLFGYVAVAPLIAYGLAAAIHLVARGFGGRGGFLAARAALLLVGAGRRPAGAGAGAGRRRRRGGRAYPGLLAWLGYPALAFWLWLLAASLAEAEGFAATGRVAAVLVAAFAGIGGLLALAAGGAAA